MRKMTTLALTAATIMVLACATMVTAASKLAWDMTSAPDAATAQTYVYKMFLDGSTTGVTLTSVTCAGSAPVSCSVAFPSIPNGPHTLTLTAQDPSGPESAPSTVLTFKVIGTPGNPRIQ